MAPLPSSVIMTEATLVPSLTRMWYSSISHLPTTHQSCMHWSSFSFYSFIRILNRASSFIPWHQVVSYIGQCISLWLLADCVFFVDHPSSHPTLAYVFLHDRLSADLCVLPGLSFHLACAFLHDWPSAYLCVLCGYCFKLQPGIFQNFHLHTNVAFCISSSMPKPVSSLCPPQQEGLTRDGMSQGCSQGYKP